MDRPIIVRYRLTPERMAEGTLVHARLNRGWLGRAWSLGCELVAFFCLVYCYREMGADFWLVLLTIVASAFVIATFALINFFSRSDRGHRAIARFLLARTPEGSKDVEWSLSDESLDQRTSLAASSYLWPLVTKVVEVPTGFLVSRGKFAFDWLPGDGFASPVDARLFAGLAQAHAKEFVLIGECRTADLVPVHDR